MSNLMPERRADKNGKVSIRWVKTGDSKGGIATIPAPKSTYQERYELTNQVANIIRTAETDQLDIDNPTAKVVIGEALFGYDTDTLKLISEGTPPTYSHLIHETVMELRSEEKALICVKLMQSYRADTDFREIEVFARGLLSYPYFKDVETPASLEGEKLAVARSLCKLSTYMHHNLPSAKTPFNPWNNNGRRYITDEALVQSIVDYPERVDEIIDFIADRGEVDGNVIRQYLENKTALRRGVL